VATTLLVAGSTLIFWIPWKTVCIHQLVLKRRSKCQAARIIVSG